MQGFQRIYQKRQVNLIFAQINTLQKWEITGSDTPSVPADCICRHTDNIPMLLRLSMLSACSSLLLIFVMPQHWTQHHLIFCHRLRTFLHVEKTTSLALCLFCNLLQRKFFLFARFFARACCPNHLSSTSSSCLSPISAFLFPSATTDHIPQQASQITYVHADEAYLCQGAVRDWSCYRSGKSLPCAQQKSAPSYDWLTESVFTSWSCNVACLTAF